MRFEHLGLTCTFTCSYHQQSVGRSPSIFLSTYRAPPAAVLLPSTHQMESSRRKLWQCGHRYDRVTHPCPPAGANAPQVICAPSCLFRHLLEGLLYSFSVPIRGLCLDFENAFIFFPVASFHREEDLFNHPGRQETHVAIGLVSLPAFLSRPLETALLSTSHTPTFLVCSGRSPAFSMSFHDAPSPPNTTAA